jgi:hypothetical protein
VENFKLDIDHPHIDGNGFDCMHGMNRDLFYHTEDSLRKQGLVEIPKFQYPLAGLYGGSLYEDNTLWRLTSELSNMKGRNTKAMIMALSDKLSEKVDMTESDRLPTQRRRKASFSWKSCIDAKIITFSSSITDYFLFYL